MKNFDSVPQKVLKIIRNITYVGQTMASENDIV